MLTISENTDIMNLTKEKERNTDTKESEVQALGLVIYTIFFYNVQKREVLRISSRTKNTDEKEIGTKEKAYHQKGAAFEDL